MTDIMNNAAIRVTIWNDSGTSAANPASAAIYPAGIHATIAQALRAAGVEDVRTATLTNRRRGCRPKSWPGPTCSSGGGISITTKSATISRARSAIGSMAAWAWSCCIRGISRSRSRRLMGTPCTVRWRADGELERIWVVAPSHPVAAGVPAYFELAREEMYCRPFEVPEPDELVFISWFKGGEVFRSGCAYRRGRGRIFYFRPGHETFPTYHDATVQRVIVNAARWVAPATVTAEPFVNLRVDPVEPL